MTGSADDSIAVTVNGQRHQLAEGTRLIDFLKTTGVTARRLAVERNGAIVPRSEHEQLVMADGDAFEVVHFVGGG